MTESINEVWEAAKAERGNRAFELFEITAVLGVVHPRYWHQPKDNNHIEKIINDDDRGLTHVRLKSIDELLRLDIERYGKLAYLWYECIEEGMDSYWITCVEAILNRHDCIKLQRKLAAYNDLRHPFPPVLNNK